MNTPTQLGQILVPENWEVRSQISYHAPIQEMPPDRRGKISTQQPPPRPNIVVARRPIKPEQTAQTLLDSLLKELAQDVSSLTMESKGEFKFDDGSIGATVCITLSATPQIRALQRHVFRIDNGISTQLVATVSSDAQQAKELDELSVILKTFRP